MKINPCARQPAQTSMLVNVPRLVTAHYSETPDASVPEQRVAFGTSGYRGSAFDKAFNEWHILAISQAICLYRAKTSMVHCFSAWIRMLFPCRRLPARWRFWRRTGWKSCSRRGRIYPNPRPRLYGCVLYVLGPLVMASATGSSI